MDVKLKMVNPLEAHPTLKTTVTGDMRFCADSHCQGACGFPALFFKPEEDGKLELKAHGCMAACGPAWQRKAWTGERVYLPNECRTKATLDLWWL